MGAFIRIATGLGTQLARGLEKFSAGLGAIGTLSMVVVLTMVVGQIFFRLFFGIGISGTFEVVELFAAVTISLVLVYATLRGRQVSVTMLSSRLPARAQAILRSFTTFIGILMWSLLAFVGGKYAFRKWVEGEASDSLSIPIAPFRFVWVLACTVMALLLIVQLVKQLKEAQK
jgi:TRAP-type C4-dicarboxylate transport system permease small subunit